MQKKAGSRIIQEPALYVCWFYFQMKWNVESGN